jgi:hypothetical protein
LHDDVCENEWSPDASDRGAGGAVLHMKAVNAVRNDGIRDADHLLESGEPVDAFSTDVHAQAHFVRAINEALAWSGTTVPAP